MTETDSDPDIHEREQKKRKTSPQEENLHQNTEETAAKTGDPVDSKDSEHPDPEHPEDPQETHREEDSIVEKEETELNWEDWEITNVDWDFLITAETNYLEEETDSRAKKRREKDLTESEQGLSWKLLQECISYLETNDENWKKTDELA